MASTRNISVEAARRNPVGALNSPTSLVQFLFEAQRVQWKALFCFEESLATWGKDCWEQWAVRYAGGMPIDG